MTDRGLNTRLRQRSRRSGLMIGISMAITIAVCVAGFSVIYAALDPFTSDFVTEDDSTSEAEANNAPGPQPTARPTEPAEEQGADQQPDATEPPASETTPTAEAGDNQIIENEDGEEDPDAFTPDYQISAPQNVRLRSGPGTDTDTVTSLTAEQPLQYLGEEQESDNPGRDGLSDGQVWMQFRTEDGDEGWVREIDVETYQE